MLQKSSLSSNHSAVSKNEIHINSVDLADDATMASDDASSVHVFDHHATTIETLLHHTAKNCRRRSARINTTPPKKSNHMSLSTDARLQ
jgi:hypothetical protein